MADLVGVNPSEAALSEQDFMQSNGEEVVEEPGSTKVLHEIEKLVKRCLLLGICKYQ